MKQQASLSALLRSTFLFTTAFIASDASAHPHTQHANHARNVAARTPNPVCTQIQNAISSASDVFFPLTVQYSDGIDHYMSSSEQQAACVVEPGTAADVGVVLQIVGSSRTPFAVKGGGHASNPGFSSTTGVQISMTRFNQVTFNAAAETADIGTGLVWDDVYEALEPTGFNIIGGRVSGVGVAGFTLGGGYSWKTNRYGLTIDTVQAFELVKPDGTVTTVTEASDSDLFFGLRGGFNNFGIVTKFTLKAFPQTQVWGGLITYPATSTPQVTAATTAFFDTVTDEKAALIVAYNVFAGIPIVTLSLFYDDPVLPPGIFDQYLAIPHLSQDVSTRSYLSLVQAAPAQATSGLRGRFHTVSLLDYSQNLLNVIVNESIHWGVNVPNLLLSGTFISYDVESFTPGLFSHGNTPTAYPPDRSRPLLPLNLYFAWTLPTSDTFFRNGIIQSAQVIQNAAIAEGQDIGDAELYGNYAVDGTALERIYGDNLPRLRQIKQTVDPTNVMGLAGGWKF